MRCEASGVNLCLRVLSPPGNENLNQLINWERHHVPIKRLIIAYHCNPNLANLNSYRKLSLCTGLKTLNVYYMNVLELSTPRFFLNFALPAALEDQQSSKKVSISLLNGDFSLKRFVSTNFLHSNRIEFEKWPLREVCPFVIGLLQVSFLLDLFLSRKNLLSLP